MKNFREFTEAYAGQNVNSADKKPVNYVGPDGKTRVKMVPAKRALTKEAAEDEEPASPDEASMAKRQLEFIEYAAEEIEDHIESGKAFPEWMQNKLSKVHAEMEGLHSALGDHESEDEEDEDEDEEDEDIKEGSESWEAGYKRRVVKTTKPEHKEKGFNWRIKGKDRPEISIKLYKEKPSQQEFNKQMKRVAGHEFGG